MVFVDDGKTPSILVAFAVGVHPFPFRIRSLSPRRPDGTWALGPGRVGGRQDTGGFFAFIFSFNANPQATFPPHSDGTWALGPLESSSAAKILGVFCVPLFWRQKRKWLYAAPLGPHKWKIIESKSIWGVIPNPLNEKSLGARPTVPYKRGLNKPFLIFGIRPTHQPTLTSFSHEAIEDFSDKSWQKTDGRWQKGSAQPPATPVIPAEVSECERSGRNLWRLWRVLGFRSIDVRHPGFGHKAKDRDLQSP